MSDTVNNGMVERSTSMRKIGVQSPVATVVKTGCYSSTSKRSATGARVTGPRR